ncbi:MAG: hypothetical protein FJ128_06560 [Deltaproteobacteria bacterium]|nr:hypothetical protein [Deltaproteobacteria bacterium]
MTEEIEDRFENLEMELAKTKAELSKVNHRNLWLLGGAVLMAGLLAFVWASAVHQNIRANQFMLLDDKGRMFAWLLRHKDNTTLHLYGREGLITGAQLDAYKDGATLHLCDELGFKRSAWLAADKDGSILRLSGEKDKGAAWLAVDKDGTSLNLSGEKSKGAAWLAVDKDGSSLRLSGEKSKGAAWLAVDEYGASLKLYDEKGKLRALLNVSKDGEPGLYFLDEKGKIVKSLTIP